MSEIPHVEAIAKRLAEINGLDCYTTDVQCKSSKGENYLGQIYFAKLRGDKTLDVVIKVAIGDTGIREKFPIRKVYERETLMYGEILPLLEDFQRRKGIGEPFAAKFHFATLEEGSETLVLDNLIPMGFKMWNRKVPMDHEHVSSILKTYGRFHALSFALKDQNPELLKKLTKDLDIVFLKDGKQDVNATKIQMNAIAAIFKNETDISSKFETSLEEGIRMIDEALKINEFSVIFHGDCWCNNMMFKYNDASNPMKPTNIRLLDFQMSGFGSVALDLSYFFYACTPKEIFCQLERYLRIYYESFCFCLKKLGSDPEKLFSFENLMDEWKRCAFNGFMVACLIIRIMLVDTDEAVELDKIAEGDDITAAVFNTKLDENLYKSRIRDLLNHMVENKFI